MCVLWEERASGKRQCCQLAAPTSQWRRRAFVRARARCNVSQLIDATRNAECDLKEKLIWCTHRAILSPLYVCYSVPCASLYERGHLTSVISCVVLWSNYYCFFMLTLDDVRTSHIFPHYHFILHQASSIISSIIIGMQRYCQLSILF